MEKIREEDYVMSPDGLITSIDDVLFRWHDQKMPLHAVKILRAFGNTGIEYINTFNADDIDMSILEQFVVGAKITHNFDGVIHFAMKKQSITEGDYTFDNIKWHSGEKAEEDQEIALRKYLGLPEWPLLFYINLDTEPLSVPVTKWRIGLVEEEDIIIEVQLGDFLPVVVDLKYFIKMQDPGFREKLYHGDVGKDIEIGELSCFAH